MNYRLILPLASLLVLASCGNGSQQTEQQQTERQAKARQRNVVKRLLPIPQEFSYLTNLGSVDITYTQGSAYSIEVEGDSTLLEHLQANFDSNLLTVSISTDSNQDINLYGNTNDVQMRITAPDLKVVSICGNGGFASAGTWQTDELQVGVLGTGEMKLDKVECRTFSLHSTERGGITISHLRADEAVIYSRSSADIDISVEVRDLTVLNDGTQHLRLRGKAEQVNIAKPDDPNLTMELQRE